MDVFERYSSLRERAISVKSKYDSLLAQAKENRALYEETLEKVKQTEQNISDLEASLQVTKALLDYASRDNVDKLTSLITTALQAIFQDRDYSVSSLVEDKRGNRTLELMFKERFSDGTEVETPLKDAIGGGVLAVIGLIINIFYLMKNHLSHVMILDEALAQVSKEYLPNVLDFLKQLSEDEDFIFIFISHTEGIIEKADTIYEVNKGKVFLEKEGSV